MIRLGVGTLIFALTGLVLQGVVLQGFLPAYIIPNLLLILVVFLGFSEVSVLGAILAFLVGFLFDLFSATLLGPWAGSFSLVYVLFALFAQRLFTRSSATIMLSVFIANAISTASYFGLLYQFQPIHSQLFSVSLVESLSSALVAPFVFRILQRGLLGNADARPSRTFVSHVFSMVRSER